MLKFLATVIVTVLILFFLGWLAVPTTITAGLILLGKACLIGLVALVVINFLFFILATAFAVILAKNK